MKYIFVPILLLFSILVFSSNTYSQDEFPVLKGHYFGQKLPGLIPELFAPGIVSITGRSEHGISFSPDLDEIYFSGKNDLYFSKIENKKWKPIQKANFTNGDKDLEIHPFVTPNGKRIYFAAINSDFTDNKIWYVNRLENSWGNAIKLDSPINDDEVFYPIQANNGDLYYSNFSKRKTYYASKNKNGSFSKGQKVEIEFGTHAFISPSQDYLLVNSPNLEDDKRKDNDIYVYFKEKDGTWTKPINLGDTVNSNFSERVPSVTPDGKYLFFSRYNEEGGFANFYWVSTEVIENVRPKL